MKNVILLLLFFFFLSNSFLVSQNKKKKIEPYQVYGYVDYWYFCQDENGNYLDDCVYKVKINFSNYSKYHVSNITFFLIIKVESSTLYKKRHTLNVDIGPDEQVSYDLFLASKVTVPLGYTYEDFYDQIEIISIN